MINGSYYYVKSKIIMLFIISLLFLRFGVYSVRETIDKIFAGLIQNKRPSATGFPSQPQTANCSLRLAV